MAIKKLEVTQPITHDGKNPVYDENRQVVLKKTLLPPTALNGLKSVNSTLPDVLKMTFKFVEVDPRARKQKTNRRTVKPEPVQDLAPEPEEVKTAPPVVDQEPVKKPGRPKKDRGPKKPPSAVEKALQDLEDLENE